MNVRFALATTALAALIGLGAGTAAAVPLGPTQITPAPTSSTQPPVDKCKVNCNPQPGPKGPGGIADVPNTPGPHPAPKPNGPTVIAPAPAPGNPKPGDDNAPLPHPPVDPPAPAGTDAPAPPHGDSVPTGGAEPARPHSPASTGAPGAAAPTSAAPAAPQQDDPGVGASTSNHPTMLVIAAMIMGLLGLIGVLVAAARRRRD